MKIDTDAAAAGAAAATAAASAAALVFTTVFTVVSTVAAAEAAAVAAAVAAAPAAASVPEEKNPWTLNIISFLVFVNLLLHMGVVGAQVRGCIELTQTKKLITFRVQELRSSDTDAAAGAAATAAATVLLLLLLP